MKSLTKGDIAPVVEAIELILNCTEAISHKVHEISADAELQRDLDKQLASIAEQCSRISKAVTNIITD